MRITSIQLDIRDQPKGQNLADAVKMVEAAPASDLLVLPEIWTVGFFAFDRYKAESESIDGEVVTALRELSVKKKCYLHTGSFVEKDGDDYYNTSLLLAPDGEIAAQYRKIHLFGYQSEERRILTAGTDVTICETPFGVMGLSTCYDLRFPEMYRMMVNRGATIFLITSAWPLVRLEAWQLFNRVRALENVSFLISCNCSGANGDSQYAGHSSIVDPLGNVLAQADEQSGYVTADLDPTMVVEIRNEFPALEDRVFYCSK